MLRKIINSKATYTAQSMVKQSLQQVQQSNNHLELKTKFSPLLIDDCMTPDEFDKLLTKTIEEAYEKKAVVNQQ